MIPSRVAPAFYGDHHPLIAGGGFCAWGTDDRGLIVARFDDGRVVVYSVRSDQPTRLYELSADDVEALRRLLA